MIQTTEENRIFTRVISLLNQHCKYIKGNLYQHYNAFRFQEVGRLCFALADLYFQCLAVRIRLDLNNIYEGKLFSRWEQNDLFCVYYVGAMLHQEVPKLQTTTPMLPRS